MAGWELPTDEPACCRDGVVGSYFAPILRLSLLAPDIVSAILRDHHPIELTAKRLANEIRLPIACDTLLGLSRREPSSLSSCLANRLLCGTTNNAVRDFPGLGRPFAALRRSQSTTPSRTNDLSPGIESRISTFRVDKKCLYINMLSVGGGRRIRTLSIPKHRPHNLMNSLFNSRFSTKTGTRDRD
jgi:hypothetical protein